MAQTNLHSVHTRVADSSAGKSGKKKMDGYAKGPIPDAMIGTKVGADPQTPYSGPNVARTGGR